MNDIYFMAVRDGLQPMERSLTFWLLRDLRKSIVFTFTSDWISLRSFFLWVDV